MRTLSPGPDLEVGDASNFASSAHLAAYVTSIMGEHPARTGNR